MAKLAVLGAVGPSRPRRANGTFLPLPSDRADRALLYDTWKHLLERCYSPESEKYPVYGARGIKVCEEWFFFESFENWAIANGYEIGLQIDRRDTNGDYTPDNCRFVTCQTNNNNRRNNRRVTAFGETKTVAEWARDPRCVVSVFTLYKRFHVLLPEVALTMPSRAGSSLRKRSLRVADK